MLKLLLFKWFYFFINILMRIYIYFSNFDKDIIYINWREKTILYIYQLINIVISKKPFEDKFFLSLTGSIDIKSCGKEEKIIKGHRKGGGIIACDLPRHEQRLHNKESCYKWKTSIDFLLFRVNHVVPPINKKKSSVAS